MNGTYRDDLLADSQHRYTMQILKLRLSCYSYLGQPTVQVKLEEEPFFRFSFGTGSAFLNFGEFRDMLLGFLPTNLFLPFIECNAMQLILLGVVIGIAILKLNPITENLSHVLDEFNSVLVLVSQWFTRLIPFFVFFILVKCAWSGQMAEVLGAWTSWSVTIGLQLAALLIVMGQICLRHRVNFFVLAKKLFSTFLIALGTNSCCATDVFFDAPCTAFCQVSAELALVQQAGKLELLDEETLRSAAA